MNHYRELLGSYVWPQRTSVAGLAVLLAGSIALQLLNPLVVRDFIDTTQRGGPQRELLGAAVLFVAIAVAQRGLALGSVYLGENVGWAATNALRADLVRHCLRLDMPFHKAHTPGELIDRIDGDVSALANFFAQLVMKVFGNGLLVLGILLLLLREDWRLGLGLFGYTIITFGLMLAVQHIAVDRWTRARAASAEHFGFLEERITGTEDLRANGGEPYVMQQLYALMRRMTQTERAARLVSNVTYVSTNALFVLGYAVGLGLGAYLYTQGQVTIGTAFVVVFYIGMLSAPLESIRAEVQDLQRAGASVGRIGELLRAVPEVVDAPRTQLPAGPLLVEFHKVSFGYEAHTGVLRNLSFVLPRGKVLGLLGRTGSGKTTLTRLLFRLYDPGAGAIRLGGVDTRDVTLSELRARVGMVTQDVQLFQASVRDNLALFNRRIDDDTIVGVLEELGLGPWLRSLPHGLDTLLQGGGHGLSAGEAQLLAFARVFLRDPDVVVLDEASSRLDPATESLLERAIDRLLGGDRDRTAIVIAHRLHTVARADLIMILDDGVIVEYGDREALARDPDSHFYRLLRTGLEEVIA